jgi:UDP-N-acetylmuramoyl-tripeptide--D-alanyl-D-alanine ligase
MQTIIPVNRCAFDSSEIIRATSASFSGTGSVRVQGVSIDTRTISPGNLFVALRGVRDGHEFLDAAAQKGATAALIEQGRRHSALPCFEVDDTLVALGALAHHHLERLRAVSSLPVIGIGGAAGKTTTKQLTAAVMHALFGEVLATPGNLNNLIGVPMTLLTLTRNHRVAVLECGTNQRGEIKRLSEILTPDIALVLNLDIEHTAGLGSLSGVAEEEAALFYTARRAIVPVSEPLLMARVPPGLPVTTFGWHAGADVQVLARKVLKPDLQQIEFGLAPWLVEPAISPRIQATLNLIGEAIAEDAAAAIAVASAAWGRPFGPDQLAAISRALASARGEAARLSVRHHNGIVLIDDSYNANPRSVRAALRAARETADLLRARLVVALGDMLELGELAPAMHEAAVRDVLDAAPEEFIAVGHEFTSAVTRLSLGSSHTRVHLACNAIEGALIARSIVRAGDVLLLKGSRGIEMERVLEGLPD